MIGYVLKATTSSARNAVGLLAVFALLLGLFAPFMSPTPVSAVISSGQFTSGSNLGDSSQLTIDSPVVTAADVGAGAVLIAQIVAADQESINAIGICGLEVGWTQVERVVDNNEVLQHIWWREIATPQDSSVNYTFESVSDSSCRLRNGAMTAMTGVITLYTGVDTDNPVGAVASAASSSRQFDGSAPAISSSHAAGSRVVRYVGTDNDADINSNPSNGTRLYSVAASSDGGPRAAAGFDTLLSATGAIGAFPVGFSLRSRWVATTVILNEPSTSEPTDTTAPVTTARGASYASDTWTNVPVNITLSAMDTGGSGVREIVYSATGALPISSTTVAGASTTFSVAAEGITTISYFARDNDGNTEQAQTFIVKIDTTKPSLTGEATTSPNEHGWYNGDVSIAWACSDEPSGIAGDCPASNVIDGEGNDLSARATVGDNAGNQTAASVIGINIDRTPPITSTEVVPGWSKVAVTLTLSPRDNLSGTMVTYYVVDQGAPQPGSQVTFDQSGVYALSYWSVDRAGNAEQPRHIEIKIDTTAPTIGHTLTPEPNASGWNNTPVTVTFNCADGTSSIVSCTEEQMLADDGANQTVIGTAVDAAGNNATDTAIVNIDQTPPVISASWTPDANASNWNNTPVTVSFDCTDETSGIDRCPVAQAVGEGTNQSVTGTATDLAGNAASATVAGINVDLTAPQITATATTTDGETYVAGSWVNQPVTVTYACSDGLSQVASCPVPRVFGEGANQSATGTAFDIAGNQASAEIESINVDLTAPTIVASATTADGQPYTSGTWARQPVTVTFLCDDTVSTVASCSAPQTLGDGANQLVPGTVTDAAGNSASTMLDSINVDAIGPTIVATATTEDGKPYISGAWTNQPVTVAFTCTDVGSGLAGPCPEPIVIDASTPISGQSVSAEVSDLAGLTASSTAIVVMVDLDAPAFTFVPDDQTVETTSGTEIVVTWAVPAAFDVLAGPVIPVCGPSSGSLFPIGTTTVNCTATDAVGNVATASFSVNVVDARPPVVTVPDDLTIPADSPSGAVVTYDAGIGVSSRVATTVVCTPPSGSRFPIGTTVVTCRASDGAVSSASAASASFTVTVLGASDILTNLRANTAELVTNRATERTLLRPLDQARQALDRGLTLRAYGSLLEYRVVLAWYARLGRVPADTAQQLQEQARQVVNAMW